MHLPLIHGGESPLFYPADLTPTAAHVPLLWIMAYDVAPLDTIEEKQRILTRAAAEGWTLLFEHDASRERARVGNTERGFVVVE
jgi:hypothetical protein